jgi:hypothetical protein
MTNTRETEARELLPTGAGICAYDLDECTVTIALDSEADVRSMVGRIPARNRAAVVDDADLPSADDVRGILSRPPIEPAGEDGVIQADRDAAADEYQRSGDDESANDCRSALCDADQLVQAFANHRLAHRISRERGRAGDEDERFLTAYVSKDTRTIGIEHPTGADFQNVLEAHVALRDRLNVRIAEQQKCPFNPATPPIPAASRDGAGEG